MKTTLQVLAEDIATGLTRELRSHQEPPEPAVPRAVEQFVSMVAQEVRTQMAGGDSEVQPDRQEMLERLQRAESELQKIGLRLRDDLQGETVSARTPLAGGESKYQNIEALLKYIESPEGEGGVKLVIMNFND